MKNLFLTAVATVGLTAATLAQVPSYVPSNGLVGWWPFNGNANDESGNGNNGTVNGVTLTTDRFGNVNEAYNFDGVDDFIEITGVDFGTGAQQSISVWVNLSTSYPGGFPQHYILDNGTTIGGVCFNTDIDQIQFGCNSISNSIGVGSWHNYVGLRNGASYEIYLDGNFLGAQVGCAAQFFNNISLLVGKSNVNTEFTNGIIDDIGIWNRALTQQEITALYNGCQLAVNTQPVSQTININNNALFTVGSSDPNASYQWQTDLGVGYQNLNNGGQYSGATTNTLTVSNVTMSNNNQPIRCIVSSGTCSDTSDLAVLTVNNNASIDALSNDKLFSVYPNPAQNQLQVKAGIELMNASYSILDNTGRTVLTGQLTSENTVIELSGLSNGTYFLNVGDQLKESFKVLKNE